MVVWVRMDHYEHTDDEHVCKSANYWKSLSEHPETPPPGAPPLYTPQSAPLFSQRV